jgi:hypothetical protein
MQLTLHTVIVVSYAHQSKSLGRYWRQSKFILFKNSKSQLQTVLITASGPQALNALAHRERYTQGSRQNRCVSLREALALRAKVTGSVDAHPHGVVFGGSGLASLSRHHSRAPVACLPGVRVKPCSPFTNQLNCQLRTAYGGESNCIIKT